MVDLTVKIGDITLQNPIQPASGAFSWEYNDVIDLNRLGALVAKTICREFPQTSFGSGFAAGIPRQRHKPPRHGAPSPGTK